ncbi:MAG TPA: nitrilase-related carbon-nitrogen hydrolase [Acidimicrobiales bacterium]|jgi:predicted amidohydrolase
MGSVLRVAAVQHEIVWEDGAATRAQVRPMVEEAADRGARLVVLPEMWPTGFSMAVDRVAEPVDGPSTAFLLEHAQRHDIWLGGSIAIREDGAERPRNCFVLAAPDGTVHRYAKRHLFSPEGEDRCYEPGDELVTVDVDGVRCTLFVCYDLRFADAFWATATRTDCYLVVANWPGKRGHHWRTLLRARAIENQAYVVGVNRAGRDPHVEYTGASAVIDPFGEAGVEADERACVIVADVDPALVRQARHDFRFLDDRRPPAWE